jgi:hypothetical protein
MLYRETVAVCSETHTKPLNTLCGQVAEFLNIGGTQSNHWALKGLIMSYHQTIRPAILMYATST